MSPCYHARHLDICNKFIEIKFSVGFMVCTNMYKYDAFAEINTDDTRRPIVQISPQEVTLKVIPDQATQVDFKVKVSNRF